jgi:hypothetical protein
VRKTDFPQADTDQTGWLYLDGYQFQHHDVSVSMHASYSSNERIIWIGPPLIPILPIFLFVPQRHDYMHFILQVEIETQSHVSIDTSQIKAYISNGKILQAAATDVSINSRKLLEHPSMLEVSNGKLSFYLVYDVPLSQLEGFVIDPGSIAVNNEVIRIKPLQFGKKTKYQYHPMWVD